jgi:anthraniloyl-CoA monooxygenase
VAAPDAEAGLPEVFAALARLAALDGPPVLVAVYGGTPLTRTLVSEQARLRHRIPSLVTAGPVAASGDAALRDQALTTVLSGRADLIGRGA